MKHFITLILSILTCSVTYAQSDSKIDYMPKCGLVGYPTDDADKLAHFPGNINKYFDKHVNWKKIELIGGLIIIDVSVDTLGRPCTVGFTNRTINTDHEVLYLYLDDVINRMPAWKPAIKDGKPVNNTTRLAVYSAVEGHKDLEVDYFRSFTQQTEKIKVIPRPVMLMNTDLEDLGKMRKKAAK